MTAVHRLITHVLDYVRRSWKNLALADIAYKLIAFIVLTPLASGLFRILLSLSGQEVLSDVDLLMFFLGPVGWLVAILLGAISLAILALEQASLLGIICARNEGSSMGVVGALKFAAAHAWPVLQVTARMVAWSLLLISPFAAIAAIVYTTLLTKYDINFYLTERPPEFLGALFVGLVLLAVLTVILLRFFSGWFFALPLVIFEGVAPSNALRESEQRAVGNRRRILWSIVVWATAMFVLSSLATALVSFFGHLVVPSATGSLPLLALVIGLVLLTWFLVGLAVNVFITTAFAAMQFYLYIDVATDSEPHITEEDQAVSGVGTAWMSLTASRLTIAVLGGIAIAVGVALVALRTVRLEDNVEIMAHRGSSADAPENTMAAIRQAMEDQADWVEIDVQETADGEVVVLHDSDFMKLSNQDLKIWDATLSEVQELDIGSWFAPEFSDERVPTLAEVLQACKGNLKVNIELKYYGHADKLEQRVADIVEAHGMVDDVAVMSLKMDGIRKMRSLRPTWKIGLLMSVAAGGLDKIDADFLAVNAGFARGSFIENAHAAGKEVYVWTVNDAPTMSAMMSRGVDGILTDRPALARQVLEQRATMTPLQRLLLELASLLGAQPQLGEQ